MKQFQRIMAMKVCGALEIMVPGIGKICPPEKIAIETPPKPELGDISFPMFSLAPLLKMAPTLIAERLAAILVEQLVQAQAVGPYVNVHLDRTECTAVVMQNLAEQGDNYGFNKGLAGERTVIEFSSPNTNKPLHLGHVRNNAIGEAVSRILAANGAEVRKVNLINNRGVHICKSMLAYKELGEGQTPEGRGVKADHFVGSYYVAYNDMLQRDPTTEQRAQDMLMRWEAGDPAVRELWTTMNKWAMEGLNASYERYGIHFDKVYYESDTYKLGREHILLGLERGVFYQDDEGTVWIDLEDIGLDKKVLLRKDGTSVYITQDVGTALSRFEDWPFDRMFYVVANEQNYHFRVLFHLLKKLELPWADTLIHLSYGMVNLLGGKMKSREGKVVDADTLLDELHALARQELREKDRDGDLVDPDEIAEAVSLAALNYYLLQVSPSKDMVFNPKESLSFNGNTGPYLQYMGARISSIFRKHGGDLVAVKDVHWDLLCTDTEWEVVKLLASFPDAVETAGQNCDPSTIVAYLYNLGKAFARFYHALPVLKDAQPKLREARLHLAGAVCTVIRTGFHLLNIPFLDSM